MSLGGVKQLATRSWAELQLASQLHPPNAANAANATMSNLQPGTPAGKEPGLKLPSNGKTIYHRPLNRAKGAELSQASFAYLFGEMVTYAQRRVQGITELEQR